MLPTGARLAGASLPWEREEDAGEVEARWRTQGKNAQVAEYGANAFKSLARSHPAVMVRHHPDLRVCEDGRIELKGDS